MPREAIVIKMQAEGVDAKVLDMDPEGPSPNDKSNASQQILLKDDPKFAKFFKMLAMVRTTYRYNQLFFFPPPIFFA